MSMVKVKVGRNRKVQYWIKLIVIYNAIWWDFQRKDKKLKFVNQFIFINARKEWNEENAILYFDGKSWPKTKHFQPIHFISISIRFFIFCQFTFQILTKGGNENKKKLFLHFLVSSQSTELSHHFIMIIIKTMNRSNAFNHSQFTHNLYPQTSAWLNINENTER